ncbi:protein LEAD-SENSITIVE 1 [Fagus crenata]
MGVLSNKIGRDNLKPGDHIYTWRRHIYSHHGIYVGEGKVIHFTQSRGEGQAIGKGTLLNRIIVSSSPSNPLDIPCPICGDQSKLDGVISSCIDCFLLGGDLYLFEYGVKPAFFLAKVRGGTCTLASSDLPKEVIHRASYLLQNGFGVYDICKNNCENFAIYCKTGLVVITITSVGGSGQASSIASAVNVTGILYSPLLYLSTSFNGLVAGVAGVAAVPVGIGMYCVNRLVSDLGVRRDVTKVPVEKLVFRTGSGESKAVTKMTKAD